MALPEIEMGVVLYQEGGVWIAQGIEYDITASGTTTKEATKKFAAKVGAEIVISLELEDEKPLGGVPPAPQRFWDMYEAGTNLPTERLPMRILDGEITPRILPHMRLAYEVIAN